MFLFLILFTIDVLLPYQCLLACLPARLSATIPQGDELSPEALEAARQQTRESALHATDLALRRVRRRDYWVWWEACGGMAWMD